MTPRFTAVSAVLAAGMAALALVPPAYAGAVRTPPNHPDLGCSANSVANPYFKITVTRGLLTCDVTEVGVSGMPGLPPSGADLSVWGPDSFTHLTHADPGIYKTVWRGTHPAGGRWCVSFVGDAWELCLTS